MIKKSVIDKVKLAFKELEFAIYVKYVLKPTRFVEAKEVKEFIDKFHFLIKPSFQFFSELDSYTLITCQFLNEFEFQLKTAYYEKNFKTSLLFLDLLRDIEYYLIKDFDQFANIVQSRVDLICQFFDLFFYDDKLDSKLESENSIEANYLTLADFISSLSLVVHNYNTEKTEDLKKEICPF